MASFGEIIAGTRKDCKRNWNLSELACKLKKEEGSPITPQSLSGIELNRRIPSPYVLAKLVAILLGCCITLCAGCAATDRARWMSLTTLQERFIREHPSFKFQESQWYVRDDVAYLLDSELYEAGRIHDIPLLAGRRDVLPLEELYMKLDKHTYWVVRRARP